LSYKYSAQSLFSGHSYGNRNAFLRLGPTSDIEGFWSSRTNKYILGRFRTFFYVNDLMANADDTVFEVHKQSTLYSKNNVTISKEVLLPFLDHSYEGIAQESVYQRIIVQNHSCEERNLKIRMEIVFNGIDSPFFSKKTEDVEALRRIKIKAEQSRIVAFDLDDTSSVSVNFDAIPTAVNILDRSASVSFDFSLGAFEKKSFIFTSGRELSHESSFNFEYVEQLSRDSYRHYLSITEIITPDEVINRGIYWAKVNVLRVWHGYLGGEAFTNDPPQDIVVVRDVAWFVFGVNYFLPSLSRNILEFVRKYCVHHDGKLTEYVHANESTPTLHDYGLNINDDTPLFILAVESYLSTVNDRSFLKAVYPVLIRTGDYILSQLRNGLVFADANGTGVEGIASWRNIIEGYNLGGYVTEINSECYAAIKSVARIARKMGDHSNADRYEKEATNLRNNILHKLQDKQTGLFYLNIDRTGQTHTDITGDLVFPALFGVVDSESKRTIINRLLQPDIWTEYGARTVSKLDPSYHPEKGMQLLGGIWHNLTAWIAMAAKEFQKDIVAETLNKIWNYCEVENPVAFKNVVPGQFPERLNGDTFESLGMSLSPWMPPTYLWLTVEGLLGLKVENGLVYLEPSIPDDWKFLYAFNIPVNNSYVNFLIYDGTVYADVEVKSTLDVRVGKFNVISEDKGIRIVIFSDSKGIEVFSISEEQERRKTCFILNGSSNRTVRKVYDSAKV